MICQHFHFVGQNLNAARADVSMHGLEMSPLLFDDKAFCHPVDHCTSSQPPRAAEHPNVKRKGDRKTQKVFIQPPFVLPFFSGLVTVD